MLQLCQPGCLATYAGASPFSSRCATIPRKEQESLVIRLQVPIVWADAFGTIPGVLPPHAVVEVWNNLTLLDSALAHGTAKQ